MALTTVRAPSPEKWTSTTCATAAEAFEIALTGVTAVNDLSAAVVVRSQPHPLSVPHEIESNVISAIRPAPAVWMIRRATGAPGPAQAQPRNRTPSSAGDLTPAATAHRTTPGMVPHRMATAIPATSRPSMSAFVVRSSDQGGQDQRAADAEDDGLRRISPEAAGDGGCRGDDQGEPGHLE